MRKHRVIRQTSDQATILQIGGSLSFAFNIETGQFDNILVTWDNSNSVVAVRIFVLPTAMLGGDLSVAGTGGAVFPGAPLVVNAGQVAYAAIGVGCQIAFPLPDMITVGFTYNAGIGNTTIRVEGDEHESFFPDPSEGMRKSRA